MEYTEKLHLNLPEDTDPLDVSKLSENFQKLDKYAQEAGGGAHKVGDILTTWRTDLGPDWLLCNGWIFNPLDYPELAAITPAMPTMGELRLSNPLYTHTGTISAAANSYATDGAKQAIIGSMGVLVSSSAEGFWVATHIVPLSINFAEFPASMIFYVNNKWIVAKQTVSKLSSFLVADDPEGEWTEVPLTNMNICVQHLEYLDGAYRVFGSTVPSTSGKCNALFGSFADFNITGFPLTTIEMCGSTANAYGAHFVRTDDRFWFFAWPSVELKTPTIYFTSTDDLGAPWDEVVAAVLPNANLGNEVITGVSWANENLVFTSSARAWIFENDAFRLSTYVPYRSPAHAKHVTSVQFVRGYYIYTVYDRLIMFQDGGGVWEFPIENAIKTMIATTATTGAALNFPSPVPSVMLGDIAQLFCLGLSSETAIGVNRLWKYAVPAISLPQSYTYIKAKE